jgi:hypothetical protein
MRTCLHRWAFWRKYGTDARESLLRLQTQELKWSTPTQRVVKEAFRYRSG